MENDCHCVGKCGVSTGICGSLTFGYGSLDDYGYWEFGCSRCARIWEKKNPKDGPCWPFSQEHIDNLEQVVY